MSALRFPVLLETDLLQTRVTEVLLAEMKRLSGHRMLLEVVSKQRPL